MNKTLYIFFPVAIFSLFSQHTYSAWIGDEIASSVSDQQYAWPDETAVISLNTVEFAAVFNNATTTADFSSNKLTLSYTNTTQASQNITYPALTYQFTDLDVGGSGIEGMTLVSSNFAKVINASFTANSITLDVPLQNTNPGETFSATFEFTVGQLPFEPDFQDWTSSVTYPYDYLGTTGTPLAGYTLDNPDEKALVVSSAFKPELGLAADEEVQEGFVMYDGTLFLEVAASDPQSGRANIRTTYRMNVDGGRLGRDFLRARYLRRGIITDPLQARAAARAGRISDIRIMRYVEDNKRWLRAVRAAGGRADVRFFPRKAPDGIVGHYGTFTEEDNTSYVWAVMDRNSKYSLGISVDNDNDGLVNGIDNCRELANPDQIDTDHDGAGNACDPDDDNDEVLDEVDNCPLDANADQADLDGNGMGDICDLDGDIDGIIDGLDDCPSTIAGEIVDASGCSIADTCPCDNGWKNHGAFMKCTTHRAKDFRKSGLITEADKGAIVSVAGQSGCGKRR